MLAADGQTYRDRRVDLRAGYVAVGVDQRAQHQTMRQRGDHDAKDWRDQNGRRADKYQDKCADQLGKALSKKVFVHYLAPFAPTKA